MKMKQVCKANRFLIQVKRIKNKYVKKIQSQRSHAENNEKRTVDENETTGNAKSKNNNNTRNVTRQGSTY